MYIVYKHTNLLNGKVYIGITSRSLEERAGKNGYEYIKDNTYFSNALKKYGYDNFSHEILEDNLTKEQACEREKYYISYYNSYNKEKGYNTTPGGDGGWDIQYLHSDKHREMARDKAKNQWENKEYQEIMSHRKNSKKVYCIELDKIFNNMHIAAKEVGISRSQISRYINGKASQAGKHPITKEPLHWKIIKE